MHCPRGSPKVESSMPRVERIGLAAQITSGRIRKNACSGARELRSPPAGEFSASRLAALFVQGRTGGKNGEQLQNFFALARITQKKAYAHPEARMTGDDLTPHFHFRVRGPDQDFYPGLAG